MKNFLAWLWSLPGTIVGCILAAILTRDWKQLVPPGPGESMTIINVPRIFPGWAIAQTWGRLVLCIHGELTNRVFVHELAHVDQWDRLGPLMFIAYPGASLWALCTGGHYYNDNWFEVQANKREEELIG